MIIFFFNYIMENNNTIEKLTKNFTAIVDTIKRCQKRKLSIEKKLDELKSLYKDTTKNNNRKIFIFCLDSCHYQYKSFKMDLEHIDEKRKFTLNRIYCDYYKLCQIIIKYIQDDEQIETENELQKQSIPVYKDLDTLTEYKLTDISVLHEIILLNIKKLQGKHTQQQDQIDHYYQNHKVGFSISNFLNTLNHENRNLEDQINLYINYMSFFHVSQKTQTKMLLDKLEYFEKDMDENLSVNHTFSINDIKDKNINYESEKEETESEISEEPNEIEEAKQEAAKKQEEEAAKKQEEEAAKKQQEEAAKKQEEEEAAKKQEEEAAKKKETVNPIQQPKKRSGVMMKLT